MQITDVAATPVSVPLSPIEDGGIAPYRTNHGELYEMDRILVRVDTDEGYTGWGEVRSFLSPEATVSVIEDGVAPMVVGQSPFELERFRRQVFIEYTNANMFFAPVETACWDIVGKALDRPVYELLGGWTANHQTNMRHREHVAQDDDAGSVEFAYALGIFPPEESRQYARRALEEGYSVLKTKAGRDWQTDVERIVEMHDEVDGRLEFRIDPNQGWTTEDAVRLAAKLQDAGVYLQYIEQPIRVDTHGSLESLRNRTAQPIAANEDTYIPRNLRQMIDRSAIDAAVVDITPAGGIAGVRHLAGIAEDGGISVAHHCAFDLGIRTAAILHTVHSTPAINLPSDTAYFGWEADVIEDPFEIENGSIRVPDEPGLGITIDQDTIDRYRIDDAA
ncbi:mandelate racemase/muconate lactonizing enzyme family protein [Salinarchaeum laminariae]|uniref:mandelate racemase/muconate lactonizing enzyme family protein n=1 Tax=Salinarchaeum laminariae TaxID=869888 RepID=UPI0020BF3D0F|nr:mandelate racemase/muconate lactonizing enzyme family protein [Salinarchaeum laminariae]